MKPVEIENERVITFFVKKIPGQQKIGKTPLCVMQFLHTLPFFTITILLPLKSRDSRDSEVFKYV